MKNPRVLPVAQACPEHPRILFKEKELFNLMAFLGFPQKGSIGCYVKVYRFLNKVLGLRS